VARLKGQLARAEAELEKWRRGESVSIEEQVKINMEQIDVDAASNAGLPSLASTSVAQTLATPAAGTGLTALETGSISLMKEEWEREKAGLYSQLDEKVK
jgi:hypothetical protein